jgi:hypothetical protein
MKITVSVALLAAQAPAAEFTDWTSVNPQTHIAEGVLGGVPVTLTGEGLYWGRTDSSSPAFDSDRFSPRLPTSDVLSLAGTASHVDYVIRFGYPIEDPVLHVGSLASTLDFRTTNLVKLSGDDDFTVVGSSVSGVLRDSPGGYDANGTVQLAGTYSSVAFTLTYSGPPLSPPGYDGIWVQIGGVPAQPQLAIRVSQVELCWETITDRLYQLEYRSDLSASAWSPLGGVTRGDGSRLCTNDPVIAGQPARLYRVVSLP